MAILTSNPTRDDIATLAKAHGFDAVRVASAHEPWDAGAGLRAFLDAGHHGDMDWLETSFARRTAIWTGWRPVSRAVTTPRPCGRRPRRR
ncbi:MAG: hypothetical protein RL186_1297 [Pseudomonadota bacterium]